MTTPFICIALLALLFVLGVQKSFLVFQKAIKSYEEDIKKDNMLFSIIAYSILSIMGIALICICSIFTPFVSKKGLYLA